MNCNSIENWLPDYAMGRLGGPEAQAVEAHLEHCSACRAYESDIQELYGVPLPLVDAPPAQLQPLPSSAKRWRSLLTWGSAAAALLLYFNYRAPAEIQEQEHAAPERASAHLASLQLALPELPNIDGSSRWIQSESEARLLSEYSGKPVLMQYINAECQRCMGVVELMEDPQRALLLEEFICFRSVVASDAPPSLLKDAAPEGHLMSSLPAMLVQAGHCSTSPAMAIASWEDVEDVMADYATHCEVNGVQIMRALEGQAFERALARMRDLPRLMNERSYNEVFANLKFMSGLSSQYRTRFAEEAERMQGELMEGLEGMVGDLEAMHQNDAESEAQSMAQDLLPGLTDTPFASRVEVLCN